MRRLLLASLATIWLTGAALAGDAEIKSAQQTVESQLKAFQAGDGATAYSFAAPSIQRVFPTADVFMSMVESGYKPMFKPQNYSFGKAEDMGANRVALQVMVLGPDGKDYEALYTLELQPDGVFRITSVSLKASNALST